MIRLFLICVFWLYTSSALAIELIPVVGVGYQLYSDSKDPPPDSHPEWRAFAPTLQQSDATIWFRQDIDLQLAPKEMIDNPLSLSVRLNGSYDFYFDGELIGSNRARGANAPQLSRILLPVSVLTPGRHQLHLRINAHGLKAGDSLKMSIRPAALKAGTFGVHFSVISAFFIAVTSLLVCLYLIFTGWTRRSHHNVTAAILVSLCCGLIILIDEGRYLFDVPYLLQEKLDYALPPAAIILLLALPWFVLQHLEIRNKLRWLLIAPLAFLLGALLPWNIEQDIQTFFFLNIGLMALGFWHWRQGQTSAKLFTALFGIASFLILLDWGKHWYLTLIMLMLVGFIARDAMQQSRAALQNALVAERLRADLLKRNIQPHFLMNSLTVLMEWIETEPNLAIDFIEGLAEEFRLLSHFADQQSIPLQDEIELCQIHVHLMSMRLDADLALEVQPANPQHQIPPAIFHTLLENAFSHNNYASGTAVFNLEVTEVGDNTSYRFSAPTTGTGKAIGVGTGTKYVQARLHEFCGKNFTFASEQIGSSWVTTIIMPSNIN